MSIEVDPDWWKTLFDEVYLLTDARSVGDEDVTRRETEVFCELLPLETDDRILDLCGGQGRHSIELCRRGYAHCTVLDFSRTLLDIGAKNAARGRCPVQFVQGDARELQYPDATFDHVLVLGNSLGYIPEPEADMAIFRESSRVLKPGGWLLIDVTDGTVVRQGFSPNAWHEIGADVVVCRHRELRQDTICAREMVLDKRTGLLRDRTYCIRLYAAEQLTGLVEAAGFESVRVHSDFSPFAKEDDLGFMNHRMLVTARKAR